MVSPVPTGGTLGYDSKRRIDMDTWEKCHPACLGWDIFNGHEIQRCDACNRFASDEDAIDHVERMAKRFEESPHAHTPPETDHDRLVFFLPFVLLLAAFASVVSLATGVILCAF